ncbi:uncharacterized protein LOC135145744 [Zophobas morio]|uniref:uncharacterized protein LOC135145744 n=1 Tax=Zophobas morio TaxID=2755281 RepID=UPI003083AFC5
MEHICELDIDKPEFVSWDFRLHGESALLKSNVKLKDWWTLSHDVFAGVGFSLNGETVDLSPPSIGQKRVGIGHSMGATALAMAEYMKPGTFSHLILIEPVMFPPPYYNDLLTDLAEWALLRRESFSSKKAAKDHMSKVEPFKSWHPLALCAYIDGGLVQREDGDWHLKCSKQNESSIHRLASHTMYDKISSILCPSLVLTGSESKFLNLTEWKAISERMSKGSSAVVPKASHYVPLEEPLAVARHVVDFYKSKK